MGKGDVEMFESVVKEGGVKGDEVLFIDDCEENCEGGGKLGMGVCDYVGGDNVEVEVEKFIV